MVKVAVGIIWSQGSILLCRRRRDVKYPFKWEFPGGKIENGETAEECLKRELAEELAICATVGEEFHSQHALYPDAGAFDVRYFLIHAYEGTLVNRAFSEIRWVLPADLPQYDVLEGNREVIRKIVEDPVS
jgi:8-oxo-dGTP diphosphatase